MTRRQMLFRSGATGAAIFGQIGGVAAQRVSGAATASLASSGAAAADMLGGQVRGYAQLRVISALDRTLVA